MSNRIFDLAMLKKISLSIFLMAGLTVIHGYIINGGMAYGGEKKIVKKGDKVKVYYTIGLEDGSVFDKSKEGIPLEFTVGSEQMPLGFDKAVRGMKVNEEKRVTVKARDAYGKRNEGLVMKYYKSRFPEGFEPKIGMGVKLDGGEHGAPAGTIIGVDEEKVILDGNHPLAGHDVVFDFKVVAIE